MSPERRDALIAAGQKATADYFDAQSLEVKGPDLEAMARTMSHVDDLARSLISP
ncbi:MAG: hypothetical protein R3C44_08935 [Chloroflexota bacterium]